MTIVVNSSTDTELQVTEDGITKTIPRSILSRDFNRFLGSSGTTIDLRRNVYNAFPNFQLIGASLIGIYSSGAGHANSDRQIMIRSDNQGVTFSSVTFFENSTGLFDTSLLTDIMSVGETAVFKVWTVERTSVGFDTFQTSFVTSGGVTYAMWSPPKDIGGTLFRTGFGLNGSFNESAYFSSPDGKVWTFVSKMFADPARDFTETAFTLDSTGDLYAVARQNGFNATRPMWFNRSTDNGATWTAPTQFDPTVINGTQPDLLLLDGNIYLMTGDRVGFTGLNFAGVPSQHSRITGISIWKSTDDAVTFTTRINTAPMFSTDGGQPSMLVSSGLIMYLFYCAPAATNTDNGVEPGLYFRRINPASII